LPLILGFARFRERRVRTEAGGRQGKTETEPETVGVGTETGSKTGIGNVRRRKAEIRIVDPPKPETGNAGRTGCVDWVSVQ
jgi:hypothetical protein